MYMDFQLLFNVYSDVSDGVRGIGVVRGVFGYFLVYEDLF